MIFPLRFVPALAAVIFAAGCATPPASDVAQTAPNARDCVKTTGSNICRGSGTGNTNNVESVSGDELRKAGGPITGSSANKIGN